jgi:hypothetical protein
LILDWLLDRTLGAKNENRRAHSIRQRHAAAAKTECNT